MEGDRDPRDGEGQRLREEARGLDGWFPGARTPRPSLGLSCPDGVSRLPDTVQPDLGETLDRRQGPTARLPPPAVGPQSRCCPR